MSRGAQFSIRGAGMWITAVAITLLVTACSGSQDAGSDFGTLIEQANRELLGEGNVDRVPDFFAEDYVSHNDRGGQPGGRAAIGSYIETLRQAFPDLEVEVQVLMSDGDRVAWRRTSRGTHRGEIAGFAPTGREVTWRDMVVTRYEDGLIAEEWAVSGLGGALATN